MFRKISVLFLFLSLGALIYPQKSSIKFYGQYESKFNSAHKRTYQNIEYGSFSWGWENYANLRFKAKIGEYITFGMAFNVNMVAGNYAEAYSLYAEYAKLSFYDPSTLNLASSNFFSLPFYYKSTYIGALELERLYFKAGNDYFNIETGLIRIARGYGYSFSPTDFLNPKNPLDLGARPAGKLAFISTFYPMPMWKIETFAVAPDDPIETKGWGFKFGAATQFNIKKVNVEFLYAFFLPEMDFLKDPADFNLPGYTNNDFSHIVGFSLKADIEIGLFIDAIYRFDQKVFRSMEYYGKSFHGYEGLEAAIGIDYTIPIPGTYASIYLLLEYMFYGSGMVDWQTGNLDRLYTSSGWRSLTPNDRALLLDTSKKTLYLQRHDYLFGMINFKLNNYVTLITSYLFGIDDQSGLLTGGVEIEPLQAFTINVEAMFPFDWEMIDQSREPGEFGSVNLGYFQNYTVSVKVKF